MFRTAQRQDLLIAFGIVASVTAVMTMADFNEWWHELTRNHERWEVDGLLTLVFGLLAGMTWLSFRQAHRLKKAIVGLQREIESRRQAQRELTLSKFALDHSGDLILWFDRGGRIVYANDVSLRELGLMQGELGELHIWHLDPQVVEADWPGIWDSLDKQEPSTFEAHYRRTDGSEFPVEVSELRLSDEREDLLCRFARNITERQRAEQALQESRERFRDFAEVASDWLWETDADLRFSYISDKVEQATGLSAAQHLGKTREEIAGLTSDTDEPGWREHLQDLRDRKPFRDFQFERLSPDGRMLSFSTSGRPVFAEDGTFLGYRGAARDITGLKRVEQALRDSERRFRDFAATASDWFWEMGPDFRFTWLSEGYRRKVGYDPDGLIGSTRWDLADDLHLEEKWARHKADLEAHRPFTDFCYKAQTEHGDIGYRSVSGIPIFDAEGTFQGYRGTSSDITEKMLAEEALIESEARLKAFLDHVPAEAALKDLDGRYFLINRQIEKLYGKTNDEVKGKMPRDIFSEDVAAALEAQDRAVVEREQVIEGEISVPHPDGLHIFFATKFPILDADGVITGIGAFSTDITELKLAENALRESEARLKAFMDHVPAEVGLKDLEGRYVLINRYAENLYGQTSERIIGKRPGEIFPKEVAEPLEAQDREVIETRRAIESEVVVPEMDGLHTYLATKFPILDANGAISGVGAFAADVTELKKAEAALRESESLLNQAAQMANLGHWVWDEDLDRCVYCSDTLARFYGMTPDEYLAKQGKFEAVLENIHPEDRARYEKVNIEVWSKGRDLDIEFREIERSGKVRHFRERGSRVLDEGGRHVRTVGILQDITEMKQAETALKESEARFRAAFESGLVGMAILSADGRFLQANQAYCDFLGYEEDELISQSFEFIVHPDDLPAVKERLDQLLSGQTPGYQHARRYRHKLGHDVWGLAGLSLLDTPDRTGQNFIVQVQDITEQKRIEEALRRTEALHKNAERLAKLGHWEWDEREDKCIYCSDELARLHGVTAAEYVERADSLEADLEWVHPDDRDRYRNIMIEATRKHSGYDFEYRLVASDGEVRHVREVGEILPGEDSTAIRWIGCVQDVTALKQTEAALRDSQAQLRLAAQMARLGAWVWSRDTDQLALSPEGAMIVGAPIEELEGLTNESFIERFVHPEDRGKVLQDSYDAWNASDSQFELEFRVVRPDGEIRTVHEVCEPRFDEAGQVVAEVGTIQDITDRKEAEEALRESEQRFKDFADASSHWLWEMGPDLRFTYISESITKITGERPSDFIDKTRRDIAGEIPADAEALRANLEQMDRHESFVDFIFDRPTTTGSRVHLALSGKPVFGPDGSFLGYRGTARDLTDRLRAEEALRESERQLRLITDGLPVSIAAIDREHRYRFVNRACEERFARTREQIIGTPAREILGEPTYQKVLPHIEAALSGSTVNFEEVATFPDSQTRYVDVTYVPQVVNDEVSVIYALSVDLTDRKRAEEALREREALLSQAAEMARLGHWVWDELEDRCIYCSETLARMNGMTVAEYLVKLATMEDLLADVHPDDRERYDRVIADAKREALPYDIEFRDYTRDDKLHYMRELGEPVFDSDGRLVRTVGTLLDITEQKRVEAEVREGAEALARAQRQAKIGSWRWSVERDELISCSEEYVRIHGATRETIEDLLRHQMEKVIHPEDRDRVEREFKRFDEEGVEYEIEYRIVRPDGEVRHVLEIGEPVYGPDGRAVEQTGTVQDVTERKRAEEALRESESRFRSLVENMRNIIFCRGERGDAEFGYTGEGAAIYGRDAQVMSGTVVDGRADIEVWYNSIHPEDRATYLEAERQRKESGKDYTIEYRFNHPKTDELKWAQECGWVVEEPGSGKAFLDSYILDITDRKRAEEALQRSNEELDQRVQEQTAELIQTVEALKQEVKDRKQAEAEVERSGKLLEDAVEALAEGFVIFDSDQRMVLCNSQYRKTYDAVADVLVPGVRFEELAHEVARRCIGLHSKEQIEGFVADRLKQHREASESFEQRLIDGRWIRVSEHRLENGWTVGARTDITELKQRQQDLQDQARSIGLLQRIAVASNEALNVDQAMQVSLDEICAYTGWPVGHVYLLADDGSRKLLPSRIWHLSDPKQFETFRRVTESTEFEHGIGLPGRALASGEPVWIVDVTRDQNFPRAKKAKNLGVVSGCAYPVLIGKDVVAVLEFYADQACEPDQRLSELLAHIGAQLGRVIERKRAEQNLRESRELLEAIIDAAPIGINVKDSNSRYLFMNRYQAEVYGLKAEQAVGQTPGSLVSPEYGEYIRALDLEVIAGGQPTPYFEEEVPDKDETPRTWLTTKVPVKGEDGNVRQIVSASLDVTELKMHEEELRQTKKMDAVGKLTGGIAHDFNNLLFVIQGNLQLLEEELHDNKENLELVHAIKTAARLGAELTRSLLAFSRQQPLQPRPVDVPETISGSISFLLRTLRDDVEIQTKIADNIWPALIDPHQLQNAVLNLAVNARDAMPHGGKLQIEVANARLGKGFASLHPDVLPGDYVKIVMSDNGVGMSRNTMEHVFEPFFTTKEAGSGTGLGLSMVYGFIKQSGGHVEIESHEGRGTTVSMYLPRADRNSAVQDLTDLDEDDFGHGDQTVLVTEDDDAVRRVAVRMLKRMGYRTLEARNGPEALEILDKDSSVDLLFTDVVMPGGLNGRQLAREAEKRRPGLKTLFASGYSREAVIRDGQLEEGVQMISKPYQAHELAQMVRTTLDQLGETK